MKPVKLCYTAEMTINERKVEVRKMESFHMEHQANNRIRKLLRENLEEGTKRYKDFNTYTIGYTIKVSPNQ